MVHYFVHPKTDQKSNDSESALRIIKANNGVTTCFDACNSISNCMGFDHEKGTCYLSKYPWKNNNELRKANGVDFYGKDT